MTGILPKPVKSYYIAMGLLKVKNIDLCQKVRRRKHKEKKSHDHGRPLGESIDCRAPLVAKRRVQIRAKTAEAVAGGIAKNTAYGGLD